jgi:hypothetical protein
MKAKTPQKLMYQCSFRNRSRVELFSINAPFWNREDALKYANDKLIEEKQKITSLYDVIVKRLTNKNY